VERIDDLADPRLEPFSGLVGRADGEHFIIEGESAVRQALEAGWPLTRVVGKRTHLERLHLAEHEVPALELDGPALRRLVGFEFHRGCLACGPRSYTPALPALGAEGVVVVAAGLADPRNLGSLIRNASAFGAARVYIDDRGADPLSRRAIRASMGHVFSVPWRREDPIAAIAELRRAWNPRVWATTSDGGASSLTSLAPPPRAVLLIGGEAHGLSPTLRALADVPVRIPTVPGAGSLNVAAATAVLLHVLAGAHAGPEIP
jgi:tRNA G18 (ribose-2'-O)-methylase SpoU